MDSHSLRFEPLRLPERPDLSSGDPGTVPRTHVRRQLDAPVELFLETISDGFLALDAGWKVSYANGAAAQMCGIPAEAMLGRASREIFAGAAGTTLDQQLHQAATLRQPVEFETHYTPWQRWLHVKASPLPKGGLAVFLDDITERKRAEAERAEALLCEKQAREEAQTLNEIAAAMAGQLDLHKLIQIVTDGATKLTGAKFGSFFYNVLNEKGESYLLYTLSGAAREDFEKLGMMPRNTPVFGPTFRGAGVVRSDDITKDPRYGTMEPHHGMPPGHLPVRSYLAAPVISRNGEVIGGMFFGHPEPGRFTAQAERIAVGIAAHAAIAIDNVGLFSRLEEELARRKAAEGGLLLLGAIVDSSDDAIISKDLHGVITSWNKSAERVFGYTSAEAVGRSVADLLIPADRQDEEPKILERLARGERVDHFETVRRRKDGSLLDISLTISPVKNPEGEIVGASKIARDITERKRAEERLQSSEKSFRQLADAMPQIVWTAGPDGAMDYYNARWYEFTGLAEGDLERGLSIIHPEDLDRCVTAWRHAVETGERFEAECRFRDRLENRWRWFMGRALAARDNSGRIVKWFGTHTDIDEQKTAADELRRANLDLEQFAYSASHDLQEPLRTIKIYSQILAGEHLPLSEPDAVEALAFLRSAATRMESLVQDLLAYTRINQMARPAECVDANAALAQVLGNLGGAIAESGAKITSEELPAVRVHSTHLQQLFQNLIGNSIKYRSPERSPSVQISSARHDDTWVFSIRDNGIGIAAAYKEQIFGLFTRLHNSDEYSGTGIGLAICKRIVERYHGRIWVESEPGRGSTFSFSLPV